MSESDINNDITIPSYISKGKILINSSHIIKKPTKMRLL